VSPQAKSWHAASDVVDAHAASPRGVGPGAWLSLALAAVLLPFSNGITPMPLAAWLAPVLLLHFVRVQPARIGLSVAFALLVLAGAIGFRGMMPGDGIASRLIGGLFALPAVVPYLFDRWLAPRLGAIIGTLVFPCAWVSIEYAISLTVGATWGAAPYSQYGNLALLQMISVTGLWGVTFLIGWLAPVCCAVWESGWESPAARRSARLFASVLGVTLFLGEARLALAPPTGPTVRIASFSRPLIGTDTTRAAFSHLTAHTETEADLDEIVRRQNAQADSLLEHAALEARAGAKIVFWGETNARAFREGEAALIERGREVARANHIYLGMALGTWDRARKPPRENKFVLITPAGAVAWQYVKTHPVPGSESRTVAGDGRLRWLDSPFGRLTTAICYDADFPALVAQAGVARGDILLDPADDWQAIDPLHTRMASFRAIEQGVNLVRQTSNGRSAAYDYEGRVLAEADDFRARDRSMVAQVPIRGVRTVYSMIGDVFAWVCLLGLVVLAAGAVGRKSNARRPA
jgi:apolipoprotein N-acyltransferase